VAILGIAVTIEVAHFAILNDRASKGSVVASQVFSADLSDGLFCGVAERGLAAPGDGDG
jgi:hypothetical protein